MIFTASLAAVRPAGVPVTPDADEARRWAAQELSKQVYVDAKPGPVQEFLGWLWQEFLDFLDGLGTLQGNVGLLVVLGVAVVVIVAAILVIRPRLNRKRARDAAVFAGATSLTADGHRALAAAAAAAGDLATAVAEQFRAVVRAAEERDVLAPAPGRTAAEVTAGLVQVFPALAEQLDGAAENFNAVHYGHVRPTPVIYAGLVSLDDALGKARPEYADARTAVQP